MPWSGSLSFDRSVSFIISFSLLLFIILFSLVVFNPSAFLKLLCLAFAVQIVFMYVVGLESLELGRVFYINGNLESEL